MDWLLSMALAGALFLTIGDLPAKNNLETVANPQHPAIVSLDEMERFEQIYSLNPNGKIDVSNVNGSITVEAWDNPQVKFEYVKTADSREWLNDFRVEIESSRDSFSASVKYEKRNRDSWNKNSGRMEVQFRLTVPRTAVLDEINTVNGSINISDMMNNTQASAVNGKVTGKNLQGTAKLSTVNGAVWADFDRLEQGSKISLGTVNGTVNLMLPSAANATIKADTVNGNITNDLGLPVRKGKYVGRDLYGRIGTGDVKINLSSVNGGLSVRRKNDGGNPNPAVNLLEEKRGNDDFDENFDTSRMNREVEESLVQSRQEMHRAIRAAEKEIEEIKPELERLNLDEIIKAAENIDREALQSEIKNAVKLREKALAELSDERIFANSSNIEKKSGSFAVKGVPSVNIEAENCKIFVRGWDKPKIEYQLTKISGVNVLEDFDFDTKKINDSNVQIKAFNNAGNGKMEVQIEIFVPRKSNLSIKTDGELRLENVSGDIDLEGENEQINVRDAGGKMRIRTEDALVRVIGFTGDFQSQMVDGTILLEGDFENFKASTDTGTIVLSLPENADASIFADTNAVYAEKINLVREKNGWRVGNGAGKSYNFTAEDGKIYIRNAGQIK